MFRPHWVCPVQGCLCFPRLHCSGSRLLYMERACVECGSSFQVLHKSTDSVAPTFCVFPGLSGSGSPRLGRALPGCGAPFPSTASGSDSQRLAQTLPGCGAPFPSAASGPGSQRLGCSLPGCGAPFPSGPSARRRSGACGLRLFRGSGFCLPSLQCLISALTQAGGGGLLFRFPSSVQSWGGEDGGCRHRHRCVWGALAVFRPHWVCPVQGCLCFPRLHCSGSRLLDMERAQR